MENMIKIVGEAKRTVTADMILVIMEIHGKGDSYQDILKESLYRTDLLISYLKEIGFDEKEIEVQDYRIHSVEKIKWNAREEESGIEYKYSRKIEVRLTVEKEKTVLDIIASGLVNRVSGELYLHDAGEICTELLQRAVMESKKKAEVIAKQLGMNLHSTVNIEYDCHGRKHGRFPIVKNIFNLEIADRVDLKKEPALYLEEQPIEIEERVSILWKLTERYKNDKILCGQMV